MAKKTLNNLPAKGPKDPVKGGGQKAGDGIKLDAKQGIRQTHSNGSQVGHSANRSGSSAVQQNLAPEATKDEFGKGTVGAPAELNDLREGDPKGSNQGSLGDQTLLYGGGYFEREQVGLEDGVSVRATMDADKTEPNYNYDIDPLTGNAPERKIGRSNNYEVSGKRSNRFIIGEM